MTKNLLDYYSDAGDDAPSALSELRLGAEPALVLLFTAEYQEVKLHFVDDETVRSYIKCPGSGCPICYAGSAPTQAHLLPVFDVESGTVKVLRIPDNRRPNALAAKLLPHLKAENCSDKLILISRREANYSVEARPLGPDARRGEVEIKAFAERIENGLQLDGAFLAMTHTELAEVPKVAARLAALGGWTPPSNPGPGGGDDAGASGEA